MRTIEIALDDETLDRARRLAEVRSCTLEDLVVDLIRSLGRAASPEDPLLGLLSSEPDVADQMTDAALSAREQQPFRLPPP